MPRLFSIIIPLFNKEKYIDKCLQGLTCQTYKDFEVIIVNDGSTDGSVAKVEVFKSKLPIKVYTTSNRGPAFARNHGASKASGKWLCFLDADDEYLPNHLETLSRFDGIEELKVLSTNFYRGGDKPFVSCDIPLEKDFSKVFNALLSPINSSNCCVLRKEFSKKDGFNESLRAFEDWHMWWRLVVENNYTFINEVTVRINIVADSLSRKKMDMNQLSIRRLEAVIALSKLVRESKEISIGFKPLYARKVNKIILATLSVISGNRGNWKITLRMLLMLNVFRLKRKDMALLISVLVKVFYKTYRKD